jgi:hypothetical protein
MTDSSESSLFYHKHPQIFIANTGTKIKRPADHAWPADRLMKQNQTAQFAD